MKKLKLFTFLLIVLSASCSSPIYYQVYKATPINEIETEKGFFVYKDINISVFYNFWSEGGESGFKFFNKSKSDIYLIVDESFFILNGFAFDYFKSKGVQNQTFIENTTICIPSNTSKYFSEFKINEILIRNCDLFKHPLLKSEIKTVEFSTANSPIVFSNRITYQLGKGGETFKFENSFYVSEITNYSSNKMVEYKYFEFCGKEEKIKRKEYKHSSFDKFYIKYNKGIEGMKH